MHASVLAWAERRVRAITRPGLSVLELGSFNVNGSVRPLFPGTRYVGVDVVPGPGVDVVVSDDRLPFCPRTFDIALSTECLEHDERPWRTLRLLAEVMKLGAPVLITARGYDERGAFPLHHPPDRWRFSAEALLLMASDAGLRGTIEPDPEAPGFFFAGHKTT